MKKISLLLIILLSFFLRFYKLESLPQAFFTDEAALGYNGWSLMTTMKDEYGKFLPLTLRSFDDYKPAIYSYLTIPFIAVSGLTQASSRAPAALFGALLPIFIYLLIKRINKNETLAIISSLVVILTPWHIEISRTAIEAGVALSLTIFALWMFASKKAIPGLIALLVTLFTYHTARIIAPIIILAALFFKVFKLSKITKISLFTITIFGILLSITSSSSRFNQISIFSDQESKLLREEAIREDGGPIKTSLLTTRILHNKPLSAIQAFSKSYITNTSLSYLFLGGAQPPRVTIPETGQFLLLFLPFFILGLAASVKKLTSFNKWLLFWLLFAPIPASLTTAEIP
ncbi:MAG: phospholipid carrier-dependent glycosyltransferase, partial [Patescibacteria group bacterium]